MNNHKTQTTFWDFINEDVTVTEPRWMRWSLWLAAISAAFNLVVRVLVAVAT